MGSAGAIQGEYIHPIIDEHLKQSDPWKRNYGQPPPFDRMVPRTYPLIDIRQTLSQPDYTPIDLLKTHGFGVVKHHSAILDASYLDQELSEQTVSDVYCPEIKKLVMDITGAKSVFTFSNAFRRGEAEIKPWKLPEGVVKGQYTTSNFTPQAKSEEIKPTEELAEKPTGKQDVQDKLARSGPIRMPHVDSTPLGARQAIRFQDLETKKAAIASGVIPTEDKICEAQGLSAPTKEADPIIAEKYNQNGVLGPRYAMYSIWRPIKKVERDPITLAPRIHGTAVEGDRVYFPYENRSLARGDSGGGEFLRELAILGVKAEKPPADADEPMKWYYVSGQEPDEVLFIKLFDSASLGEGAEDAWAPWHASPEIGMAAGEAARESIEIRVIAFW